MSRGAKAAGGGEAGAGDGWGVTAGCGEAAGGDAVELCGTEAWGVGGALGRDGAELAELLLAGGGLCCGEALEWPLEEPLVAASPRTGRPSIKVAVTNWLLMRLVFILYDGLRCDCFVLEQRRLDGICAVPFAVHLLLRDSVTGLASAHAFFRRIRLS